MRAAHLCYLGEDGSGWNRREFGKRLAGFLFAAMSTDRVTQRIKASPASSSDKCNVWFADFAMYSFSRSMPFAKNAEDYAAIKR
jgi:hypothetical protein